MDFRALFRNADAEVRQPGDVVFSEGETGTTMYVVREGELEIRVAGETVEKVGPGGIVGEMALIDPGPRSATVVVSQPSELVCIDEKRFLFLVRETPFFALNVMAELARRLRAMNARTKS